MTIRSTITVLTIAVATLAANFVFTAADANARSPSVTRVTSSSPPPPVVRRPNGIQGNVSVTNTPRTPGIVCKGWTCPTVVKSNNRDHRR